MDNKNNDIIHTKNINSELKEIIKYYSKAKVIVLTDENCNLKCYSKIKGSLPKNTLIKTLKSGEENKNIKTLTEIWDFFIKNKIDRNSLLINLGGGVITDIGGFAASTFKRGFKFINIPTSLLAQTDASIGGKTGINYQNLKNEIGIINKAEKVIISTGFLESLPTDEFLSGFAEMIKHALIFDKNHYKELKNFYNKDYKKLIFKNLHDLIIKSVNIKQHFIKKDINDKGIRQTLNFGHTFGHAFESFFNQNKHTKIKHGEAVAFGMLCELYISTKRLNFKKNLLKELSQFITNIYGGLIIPKKSFNTIFSFMMFDKKNISGEIKCILIKELGKPQISANITKEEIFNALTFLNKISE